jgi:hypothetical protein
MPNLYFDQVLEKNPQPDMPIDMSYNYIFGNDGTDEAYEYHGIPKSYYIETYAMYDTLSDGTSGDIERSFINTDKNTGNNDIAHGTNFYPLMGDAGGETNDVMFLKNRSMFKTGLDFTVGALGMTSNP